MTVDASAPVNPDISVFVDDVDRAYEAATVTRASIDYPLSDEEWGVRRSFYRDAGERAINLGTHA